MEGIKNSEEKNITPEMTLRSEKIGSLEDNIKKTEEEILSIKVESKRAVYDKLIEISSYLDTLSIQCINEQYVNTDTSKKINVIMEMDNGSPFYLGIQSALADKILFISKLDGLIDLSDSKDFVKNGKKLGELSNLVYSKMEEIRNISFEK